MLLGPGSVVGVLVKVLQRNRSNGCVCLEREEKDLFSGVGSHDSGAW